MTSAAASLARRARRSLLTRRVAEAGAAAGAAGLAVGVTAQLEGWAAPVPAAVAAALAMLAAFWSSARACGDAAAALSSEADQDALLRSALASTAGADWRELLASSAAGRTPRHQPVGEWIPAALLAAAAIFALAWQDSRPNYAPSSMATPAAGPGAAASASAPRPRPEGAAQEAPRDGGSLGAQGEWRSLDPAASEGSILLPPGAAARERSAIERYLRHRAEAAE